MYQRTFNNSKIFLALYVDDGLLMGEDEAELQSVISQLEANFEINEDNTPADNNVQLKSIKEENTKREVPYREAVGSLIFAAIVTRPDIAYAVGVVSRFLDKHEDSHWNAVKRIIRYLKNTIDYEILYTKAQ